MSKLNVLIAGATGYLGNELIKILAKHKKIKIKYLCGNSSVGKKITDFDKSIKYELPKITKITKSKINECDIIFSAQFRHIVLAHFKYKCIKSITNSWK